MSKGRSGAADVEREDEPSFRPSGGEKAAELARIRQKERAGPPLQFCVSSRGPECWLIMPAGG
jgi:hypothetical protein